MPAKKRTSKKLDPKQLFVVVTYSRGSIAEELNMALETIGDDTTKEFTHDDPRLTDKVCKAYVNAVYDSWANIDEVDDAAHQVSIKTLEQFTKKK
jgi:hypothetical protein